MQKSRDTRCTASYFMYRTFGGPGLHQDGGLARASTTGIPVTSAQPLVVEHAARGTSSLHLHLREFVLVKSVLFHCASSFLAKRPLEIDCRDCCSDGEKFQ
jgi:hypothetical protein